MASTTVALMDKRFNIIKGSAHGVFHTEIDESSLVFNGNGSSGQDQNGRRVHVISGVSVRNESVLFNGDLDRKKFLKIYGQGR